MNEIKLSLLTNEEILALSNGCVTKHDTFHHKTLKPIFGGLFCPKIFGNQEDYKCFCGKYKGIEYKDIICNKCNVIVAPKTITRVRWGHIKLPIPIAYEHILIPILKLSFKIGKELLKSVLKGNIGLKILNKRLIPSEDKTYSGNYGIYLLIKDISTDNLPEELQHLKEKFSKWEDFWYKYIPVIPAGLRPQIVSDTNGPVISHDFNKYYSLLIYRSNKTERLIAQNQYTYIPQNIIQSEYLLLNEQVQNLFKQKAKSNLKSISDSLGSKNGLIRNYILGKRVDFTARSVITVNPKIKTYECVIPRKILIDLFKPIIRKRLSDNNIYTTNKTYGIIVEEWNGFVDEILQDLSKEYKILLNRNPTLYRYGIQAFNFLVGNSLSIGLPPLVCKTFGADFDGDEMNIYLNYTKESQEEINRNIFRKNIVHHTNGDLMLAMRCELRFALFYYTNTDITSKEIDNIYVLNNDISNLNVFSENYYVRDINCKKRFLTIFVYKHLVDNFDLDYDLEKFDLMDTLNICKKIRNADLFLDFLKEILFELIEFNGLSVSISSLSKLYFEDYIKTQINLTDKMNLETSQILQEIGESEEVILSKLKFNWQNCLDTINKFLLKEYSKQKENIFVSVVESKARGNIVGLNSMVGIRGLTSDSFYKISPVACTGNFYKGLTLSEFMLASTEGRKNFSAKINRAASDGYFCRKMVMSAYNLQTGKEDCGTKSGIWIKKEESLNRYSIELEKFIDENDLLKLKSYVYIRTAAFCLEEKNRICLKCYGLRNSKISESNQNVGIQAAHSLSEPGTQLSIQTKKEIVTYTSGIEESYIEIIVEKDIFIKTNPNLFVNTTLIKSGYVELYQDDNLVDIIFLKAGSIVPQINVMLKEDIKIKSILSNRLYAFCDGNITFTKNEHNNSFITMNNCHSLIDHDIDIIKKNDIKRGDCIAMDTGVSGYDSLSAYKQLKTIFESGTIKTTRCSKIYKENDMKSPSKLFWSGIAQNFEYINYENMAINSNDFIRFFGINHYIKYLSNICCSIYENSNLKVEKQEIELIISSLIKYTDKNGKEIHYSEYKEDCNVEFLTLVSKILQSNSWNLSSSFQRTFNIIVESAIYNKVDYKNSLFNKIFFNIVDDHKSSFKKK